MIYIATATGTALVSTSTCSTSSTLNVAAGDVLVSMVSGGIGSTRTVSSIDDGTDNAHTITEQNHTFGCWSIAHVLSADVNATATITATISDIANDGAWAITVFQFRPAVGETVTHNSTTTVTDLWSGAGGTFSSGALSALETDSVAIGNFQAGGGGITTPLLGGVTPDGTEADPNGLSKTSSYKIFSTLQTSITHDADIAASQVYVPGMMLLDVATAASASVDDINTTEIVLDAEQDATFSTSNFAGEITSVKLVSGTAETDASGVTSTSGAGTFDLPDVAAYIAPTVGCPLTTANNVVVARLTDA